MPNTVVVRWCFLSRRFGFDQRPACDPHALFRYIASMQAHAAAPALIPCSVIFSDDGTPFPGHEPEQALNLRERCWCTRGGVNRNIDLVLKLGGTDDANGSWLITKMQVATPGLGYSNAPREVLAWCSMDPPDLSAARQWDLSPPEIEQSFRTDYAPSRKETSTNGSPAVVSFLLPPRHVTMDVTMDEQLLVPKVAQFVHFKILSSFDPDSHGPTNANVDVKGLWVWGVPLGELERQWGVAPAQPKADPSYARLHGLLETSNWISWMG